MALHGLHWGATKENLCDSNKKHKNFNGQSGLRRIGRARRKTTVTYLENLIWTNKASTLRGSELERVLEQEPYGGIGYWREAWRRRKRFGERQGVQVMCSHNTCWNACNNCSAISLQLLSTGSVRNINCNKHIALSIYIITYITGSRRQIANIVKFK